MYCMDEWLEVIASYVCSCYNYYFMFPLVAQASQEDVNLSSHPSLLAQGKGSHGNHVTSNHVCYHYQMHKCGSLSRLLFQR